MNYIETKLASYNHQRTNLCFNVQPWKILDHHSPTYIIVLYHYRMVRVSRRLNLLENPFRISVKRNKNVKHHGAIQSAKQGFCAHKTTYNNSITKEPIWQGNSILEYHQSFFFFYCFILWGWEGKCVFTRSIFMEPQGIPMAKHKFQLP